jgi:hypothetical protein
MRERGPLGSVSTAELLRRLAAEGATGCLRLERGDLQVQVWLRDGAVCTASAAEARMRIGDRLVGAGHVSGQQLASVLQLQGSLSQRPRLGELLVSSGLVERRLLNGYLREQAADSLAVALGWADGVWSFATGEETDEDLPLDMSLEDLLMESTRRLGEWEVIRSRLGSPQAVVSFVRGGGPSQLSLTHDEWSMLARIDGARTLRELAEASGYGLVATARAVYGLLTAGVVEVTEP